MTALLKTLRNQSNLSSSLKKGQREWLTEKQMTLSGSVEPLTPFQAPEDSYDIYHSQYTPVVIYQYYYYSSNIVIYQYAALVTNSCRNNGTNDPTHPDFTWRFPHIYSCLCCSKSELKGICCFQCSWTPALANLAFTHLGGSSVCSYHLHQTSMLSTTIMKKTNKIHGLFFFLSIIKKNAFCTHSNILANYFGVTIAEKRDIAIKS